MTKEFKAIIKRCQAEVATWPQWKQDIEISAYSASTGDFHRKKREREAREKNAH